MEKGKIKSWDSGKGSGFIEVTEGNEVVKGTEVILHFTGINFIGYKTPHEGDNVKFNIIEGGNGDGTTRYYASGLTILDNTNEHPL